MMMMMMMVNPKLMDTEFGLIKLEISLYRVVQNAFRYRSRVW